MNIEIPLKHTHEWGEMKIGTELPSTSFHDEEDNTILFPVREMKFYGSKVILKESNIYGTKKLTVFGFKKSMPYKSEHKNKVRGWYDGYGDVVTVNFIDTKKHKTK